MEVHHHSHSPRKKFTHYLWEFLMLFLAVFCGFMAENFREHLVEHKKEKDYMKSLLADLVTDTSSHNRNIQFWEEQIVLADSFFNCLKKQETPANTRDLYRLVYYSYDFSKFNYNDRTVAQLKSTGNFRLIRKKQIADDIISYDNSVRINLISQEQELESVWITLMNKQATVIDYRAWPAKALFLNETNYLTGLSGPALLTKDKIAISELMELSQRKIWLMTIVKQNLVFLKQEAGALIGALKKEYHLQ